MTRSLSARSTTAVLGGPRSDRDRRTCKEQLPDAGKWPLHAHAVSAFRGPIGSGPLVPRGQGAVGRKGEGANTCGSRQPLTWASVNHTSGCCVNCLCCRGEEVGRRVKIIHSSACFAGRCLFWSTWDAPIPRPHRQITGLQWTHHREWTQK